MCIFKTEVVQGLDVSFPNLSHSGEDGQLVPVTHQNVRQFYWYGAFGKHGYVDAIIRAELQCLFDLQLG